MISLSTDLPIFFLQTRFKASHTFFIVQLNKISLSPIAETGESPVLYKVARFYSHPLLHSTKEWRIGLSQRQLVEKILEQLCTKLWKSGTILKASFS